MKKLIFLSFIANACLAISAYPQTRNLGVQKTPQTTSSQQRVALVIGNGAYASSPLKNPVNDARSMAQALRELGFDVISQENLSLNDMKRAIRAFGEKARSSSVRLFYYAGHGMQVNGENYLIPVDATFKNEYEVEYEAVNAGFVLAQLDETSKSLNIVILDACRNNPFARSFRSLTQGLAAINAPSGTLIAYATAPGSVASDGNAGNGLYTQELLRSMRTPGVGVEELFKQVRISVREKTQGKQTPWESSSLTGEFYFISRQSQIQQTATVPTQQSFDPAAMELSFWDSVKNSNEPEDFNAYLERYPNGNFSSLAKRKIQSLQAKTSQSNVGAPPASKPVEQTAKSKFFTFTLHQCRMSGPTVVCDLSISNDENGERPLSFYRLDAGRVSKAFDDQGVELRMSANQIANKNSYDDATLVAGVPVRATATFEGISPQAKNIKLLTLWFNTIAQGFIVDSFKVEYRNVILAQ
jgi:hypothetical protein